MTADMPTSDPESDHATLAELNRDYIASVQSGDVRRFQELLASDFHCSNPDGRLINRAEFLLQTSQPITIIGLVSEDVQIRLFGDIAIIHAATRYCTAAGEERRGRYTDVWARRGGKWLAISAHVTR